MQNTNGRGVARILKTCKTENFAAIVNDVFKVLHLRCLRGSGYVFREVYLGVCQTPLMELFANSLQVLFVNGFEKDCIIDPALREKCPNTELFLVRIFPHSD